MKEIGVFFRESFEGVEKTPPPHIWENISKNTALKKYNRKQWWKKSAWYGLTIIPVTTAIVILFRIVTNSENMPAPQKETVSGSENTATIEEIFTSHNLFQEIHEITKNSNEPVAQNAIISPPITHPSTKTTTGKTAQKREKVESAENEESLIISALQKKKATVNPSINKETLPRIPVETRNMSNIFEEEDYDDDAFPDIKQTTHSLLHIPNAFSPNGDGFNDIFLIYSSAKIFDYQITIYDRLGQLVYHSKQIETGWDGTFKGAPAPQGTYVYIITFTNEKKEKMIEQGPLLLVR